MKKTTKPCPTECAFDWVDFHKKFDIAIAHMIDESEILPSETSIFEMIEYSFAKQKLQKGGKKN